MKQKLPTTISLSKWRAQNNKGRVVGTEQRHLGKKIKGQMIFCMVVGKSSGMVVGIGTGANDTMLLSKHSPSTYGNLREILGKLLFFLDWGGLWILVISTVLSTKSGCGVGVKKKNSL